MSTGAIRAPGTPRHLLNRKEGESAMPRWACQDCGDAYISEPPDTGLCPTCQQQHDHDHDTAWR